MRDGIVAEDDAPGRATAHDDRMTATAATPAQTNATDAPHTTSATNGIELVVGHGVATLLLQLPRAKNAFRAGDATRLGELIGTLQAPEVRCVVIRGAGDAFSAGWDIGSVDPRGDDPVAMIRDVVGPLLARVRSLPLPTIAAVAGPALGFGFGLALCCDVVLAEEEAVLGSPFRNIGMVPDSGTHHILRDRLGHGRAAELIYTGRLLSGREAAALGLVNRAVAKGTLIDETERLAREIASGPTVALALSKEILLAGGDFDAVVAREAEALRACFATADLKEGMAAFMQKRRPAFRGQ